MITSYTNAIPKRSTPIWNKLLYAKPLSSLPAGRDKGFTYQNDPAKTLFCEAHDFAKPVIPYTSPFEIVSGFPKLLRIKTCTGYLVISGRSQNLNVQFVSLDSGEEGKRVRLKPKLLKSGFANNVRCRDRMC